MQTTKSKKIYAKFSINTNAHLTGFTGQSLVVTGSYNTEHSSPEFSTKCSWVTHSFVHCSLYVHRLV